MSSFANLKRNAESSLETVRKAANELNSKSYNDDSHEFWKPELDKSGGGFAIIRFLPISSHEKDQSLSSPWVRYYDHGFQGPGGWYIEKCRSTLGEPDPCMESNSVLWESGIEVNKELARTRKRRLHYVSNIYVVKDAKNPENEGKCFKYVYGKKIMERLLQAMNPQFEDDVAFDPFNLWTGANFKLKIRKVDGQINYDLSSFETPGPLSDDDSELERIWKEEYCLSDVIAPEKFKSYDQLKNRLDRVLGGTTNKPVQTPQQKIRDVEEELDSMVQSSSEEEDDDLKFFDNLNLDDD